MDGVGRCGVNGRDEEGGWGDSVQLPASGSEAGAAAAGETGHLLSRRPWRRRLRAPPLLRRRKKWRLLLQLRLGLGPSKKPRRREGETRRTF